MTTDLKIEFARWSPTNPATGEVLREFECAPEADVHAAVSRASAAQANWAAVGVRKRIAILRDFQDRLHQRKSEVANWSRAKPANPTSKPC